MVVGAGGGVFLEDFLDLLPFCFFPPVLGGDGDVIVTMVERYYSLI
jgi:hypothetical protein